MSRSSARTERSSATIPRGRPKRRAATKNYLFKYQLSGDPGRVEENALKKALQESLEEHKSTTPMTAGAAVIASKQIGKNKFQHNSSKSSNDPKIYHHHGKKQQKQHGRDIMNSSTNSSDVSKASNDSSNSTTTTGTTFSSSGTCRDTLPANGRSNGRVGGNKQHPRPGANIPILASTPTKARAKLMVRHQPYQSSWALLGVPEEKILYLRDDEPPRRLICYPAIKHIEGDVIQARDSVLLRSGAKQTDLPYIAKVCAFWQDAESGRLMMSLFWYYRPEHTEDGRKPHHLIDEIFASRHRDVDSVECIEDKCYVLTFNEYCRYRKRCKMDQVNATWSLTDVTIPVSNESYPRRNRIPDSSVSPELVFCCRQIYDSRSKRLVKNPLINPKYGNI